MLNTIGRKVPSHLYKKLEKMYESKKGATTSTALVPYDDDDDSSSEGDQQSRTITCSVRLGRPASVNAAIALNASKIASTSASSRGGRGGRDGRGAARRRGGFIFLRQPAPAACNLA